MISIVVPVYKSEKTLAGCLDSLLAQTYQDIEVICVIDGSPDRCGEICDSYAEKDGRVKVIKRENGGVSSARNRGIDEANGKYLSFVDSDDYIESNMLEKLYSAAEASDADLTVCGYYTEDEHGNKKESVAYRGHKSWLFFLDHYIIIFIRHNSLPPLRRI